MTGHVAALGRYYRQRQRRKLLAALSDDRPWDENVILEWLSILRIPPFERIYPVQSKDAACLKCSGDTVSAGNVDFRAVFPGGSLRECRVCKTAWLVTDGTRDATPYVRGPGVVEEPKGGRH